MSSSGLIYAVIVGAWAAYLVPMWLRRQDELNEARPTERFSTAIRLLSGRAGMERRYAKAMRNPEDGSGDSGVEPSGTAPAEAGTPLPGVGSPAVDAPAVDLRALAVPAKASRARGVSAATPASGPVPGAASASASTSAAVPTDAQVPSSGPRSKPGAQPRPKQDPVTQREPGSESEADRHAPAARRSAPERGTTPGRRPASAQPCLPGSRRAKVLARRRRTTSVLFLAFTAGAVAAGIGGLPFLWAPAAPGALLTAYIAYLRRQESLRFEAKLAKRQRQQEARAARAAARSAKTTTATTEPSGAREGVARVGRERAATADREAREARDARKARQAVVEETDHAEWVDGLQRAGATDQDNWDPVPVPLPTYVTAPVAPRGPGQPAGQDGDDAWPSDTPTVAPGSAAKPDADRPGRAERGQPRPSSGRRARERGRTPLFDQYDGGERPRAANE